MKTVKGKRTQIIKEPIQLRCNQFEVKRSRQFAETLQITYTDYWTMALRDFNNNMEARIKRLGKSA